MPRDLAHVQDFWCRPPYTKFNSSQILIYFCPHHPGITMYDDYMTTRCFTIILFFLFFFATDKVVTSENIQTQKTPITHPSEASRRTDATTQGSTSISRLGKKLDDSHSSCSPLSCDWAVYLGGGMLSEETSLESR